MSSIYQICLVYALKENLPQIGVSNITTSLKWKAVMWAIKDSCVAYSSNWMIIDQAT